jgi:hypothetical protein
MAAPPLDQKTLTTLGIELSPSTILILKIVVPIVAIVVVAVGTWLFMRWQARKKSEASPPPPVDATGGASVSQIRPGQLRDAWQRFTAQLPAIYRRSILNFDHFVVLGAAAAGKSRVISAHTDWKRLAKQFLGSQSYDPDLQVYVASSAIVTEVPANILGDHSDRCRSALKNLWKPLYRHRAPTVIVVVDAIRLRDGTSDSVSDLADTLRGKINLLSSIRKRRIDVRVTLTHLDEIEGYTEFAAFCRAQGISTRIPFTPDDLGKDLKAQLEGWITDLRAHLPRALTKASATDFKRIVAFLRRAPEIVPSLVQFLGVLYSHEVTSLDLIPDGVYLASDPPGVANPLLGAAERGPGPNPRRRHELIAVAVTSAVVAFLVAAYRDQRSVWLPASEAIASYKPGGTPALERMHRSRITQFTSPTSRSAFLSHPDFFSRARADMRSAFSEKIRAGVLEERLKTVVATGEAREGQIPLPQRRSLYVLALIHSDKHDYMKILAPNRHAIWSEMTNLDEDLIADYLHNTDVAYASPISFEFPQRDVDALDMPRTWITFLREVDAEIADGVIRPAELKAFQSRAAQLLMALDRFEHDDLTLKILEELEVAAELSGGEAMETQIHGAYTPRYTAWLSDVRSADLFAQRNELKRIFRVISEGQIQVSEQPLLRNLVDRVALLYGVGTPMSPEEEKPVLLKLTGQELSFDPKRWRELIRDSTASEQIAQFMRAKSNDGSIFFSRDDENALHPVSWNPTNDGSAIFVGRASLDGRYTRDAFERHVRDVVNKLGEVLDKSKISDEERRGLSDFVREQVRRYATEYRGQLVRFVGSFGLHAGSQEALRVALSQMVADQSPFNDYLVAVDRNATIDTGNAPLLVPMRDAVADFGPWHAVVDGGGAAPELKKYRAILGTLLADLGPPAGADTGKPTDPTTIANETLEKALTPAGRVVLANLRGEKGSYAKLVGEWLASVHLPAYQEGAFLAPLLELNAIGKRDIDHVLTRTWERDMLPDVLKIMQRYPFDPDAKDEVTPRELTAVFHPQNGRFFDYFRRYLEPVSDFGDGAPFRQKGSTRGSVNLPPDLYPVVNAAAILSSRFWDPNGKPIPLVVRVQTLPFPHGINPGLALTLIYMNAGDQSVFNFNQQPGTTFLNLDWTKETLSQVGVQLTDLESKENTFPEPVVTQSSFWSFLRLLRKGSATPARQPADAQVYTWNVKIGREGTDTMPIRFVVLDDPWDKLGMGKLLKARVQKGGTVSDG